MASHAVQGLLEPHGGQYDSSWLMTLELLAVQPVCLKAHPMMPPQQQQQQDGQLGQENIGVDGTAQVQQQLLLHVEVTCSRIADPITAGISEPGGAQHAAATVGAPLLPLLLQHAQLELMVLSRQMLLLRQQRVGLLQAVQQQQPEPAEAVFSPVGSSSWSVLLNLATSVPCLPTDRLLDCCHLVLMVTSSQQQQQQGCHEAAVSSPVPAGAVIANVPLLLLPAAAQQEVQQLLLPAMRQEVQAEQQLHGLLAGQQSVGSFMHAALQVEHAVWRHYCQLAHDVHTVIQLSAAAEEAAVYAAQGQQEAVPAVGVVNEPSALLAQMGETMLFPLLLPFLAAQGVHSLQRLLLECLPQGLQQQWQQQEPARLQQLVAAAPALQLSAVAIAEGVTQEQRELEHNMQHQQQQWPHVPAGDWAHESPVSCDDSLQGVGQQQQQQQRIPVEAANKQQQQQLQCTQDQQPQAMQQARTSAGAAAAGAPKHCSRSSRSRSNALGKQAAAATAGKQQAMAATEAVAAAAGVPWYLPLTQFPDGAVEQSYLAWKQHSLLHLDYLAAVFGLLYLAVVLRRLLHEPTTLFYFAVILTKVLPHVPLVLGMQRTFLRYRETWLLLVAPAMLSIALVLSLPSIAHGQPALLLPNRAYRAYWSSRGELQTTAMRPFTQHMRLKPYILYSVLDAAISAWVFGQAGFGFWAAVRRWATAATLSIALSWGFDLYMRRRFVRAARGQLLQQQQHWE